MQPKNQFLIRQPISGQDILTAKCKTQNVKVVTLRIVGAAHKRKVQFVTTNSIREHAVNHYRIIQDLILESAVLVGDLVTGIR